MGKRFAMDQSFVYCGSSCEVCPRLRDGSCEGCLGELVVDSCRRCEVRICCGSRGIPHCGLCDEYPCVKVDDLYARWTRDGFAEGAAYCRLKLDTINAQRKTPIDG